MHKRRSAHADRANGRVGDSPLVLRGRVLRSVSWRTAGVGKPPVGLAPDLFSSEEPRSAKAAGALTRAPEARTRRPCLRPVAAYPVVRKRRRESRQLAPRSCATRWFEQLGWVSRVRWPTAERLDARRVR
jgi:hypothetical protein